jgi:hypothetical protein
MEKPSAFITGRPSDGVSGRVSVEDAEDSVVLRESKEGPSFWRWTVSVYSPKNAPPWLRAWSCLICVCCLFESIIYPYAQAFPWANDFLFGGISVASTAVFAFHTVFVSWRVVKGIRPTAAEAFALYARTWMWVDLVAILPWRELLNADPELDMVRLLRLTHFRLAVPVLSALYRSMFPRRVATGYSLTLICPPIFVFVWMHIVACNFSSIGLRAYHEGRRSWIYAAMSEKGLPMDEWMESSGLTWDVYSWAFYLACATFTTVGYGDISAHSEEEAVVMSFVMIVSSLWFSLCLAIFSTIVADFFHDIKLKSSQAKSLARYLRYRKDRFPKTFQAQLTQFIHQRTPETYHEEQLVLPLNPNSAHFLEYETKVMNACPADLRTDLRMYMLGGPMKEASCLYWLTTVEPALKQAVEAASVRVYAPGDILFERDVKVKHLLIMTSGAAQIEELPDASPADRGVPP